MRAAIPKVHLASLREDIFAGVVSEHQHLFSLMNFKTVTHAVLFPECIIHQSGKAYLQE